MIPESNICDEELQIISLYRKADERDRATVKLILERYKDNLDVNDLHKLIDEHSELEKTGNVTSVFLYRLRNNIKCWYM